MSIRLCCRRNSQTVAEYIINLEMFLTWIDAFKSDKADSLVSNFKNQVGDEKVFHCELNKNLEK